MKQGLRWALHVGVCAMVLWAGWGLATPTAPPMSARELAPGVFMVQGLSELGSPANQNFISNAGFVITPEGVVVIDALGSPELARRLLAEIQKRTSLPVKWVILTHYHADHIYGLQVLKEAGAQILAHERAREYLNSESAAARLLASRQTLKPWIDEHTRLVSADRWIQGPQTLTLGGIDIQVHPVGPSHTAEDLVIYVPSRKVLFAGDLVFRNRIPFVGQADSRRWVLALDRLLAFDAQVIVPGHGPETRDAKQDITLTRDYLRYIRETMGKAAADMVPFEEAYRQTDWRRFENLPLFKSANRMNAYNTYLLMEQESK